MRRAEWAVCLLLCLGTPSALGQAFVNWESPHVHPLDLTPDGTRVLAVNTADNRLEVFSVGAGALAHVGSVPVGLDPVSVRARTSSEAWVVNHISDSISIVDLVSMNVIATIATGDEPADVVFAGAPQRAFVSVSQLNQVRVYDPANLAAAPTILAIQGEDPRALATDGTRVYAAFHESGNNTTIIAETVVSSAVNPYPGDENPPPNDGTQFEPNLAPALPAPPPAGLIVRKASDGTWRDDNNGDWSAAVTWDLHDHDVAIIDAASLAITYAGGMLTTPMAISVRPGGQVTIVGSEALNQVRFEPRIRGVFARMLLGSFDPTAPAGAVALDLNPHLNYSSHTTIMDERLESLGDPRGIAWSSDGQRAYVSGLGSNNVIEMDASGVRLATIDVGEGPTGVVLDEARSQLYVLHKFAGAVGIVSIPSAALIHTAAFHDPTPEAIRAGRPALYGTQFNSGLGHVSCATCHIDGRMDQLAWDLGDPSGAVKTFDQICNAGLGGCEDWHPMKGPMATQTLIGAIGTGPLHWRGDRANLGQFNPAFVNLLGADSEITSEEMAAFEAFLAETRFPPNPNRNFNNSLPTTFPNGGNPATGNNLFQTVRFDGGVLTCNNCHTLPSGTNTQIISGMALLEPQSMKVPQLRNMYEKTGFDQASSANNRGFGFTHDGAIDSLFDFLMFPGFNFAAGATGNQQRRDLEAFMFCFPTGTHAAVGVQTTINSPTPPAEQTTLIGNMVTQANTGNVSLVVKGRQAGLARGYSYLGGDMFQSDRAAEQISRPALIALAAPANELTFTVVPSGSQTRIGIDRDQDGFFDRDELDACADPADAASTPLTATPPAGDIDNNQVVDLDDLLLVLGNFGCVGGCSGDADGDGDSDLDDLLAVLGTFGATCPG